MKQRQDLPGEECPLRCRKSKIAGQWFLSTLLDESMDTKIERIARTEYADGVW